jgi:hypothetical protein
MSAVENIQVLFSQVTFLKHLIPLLFHNQKKIVAFHQDSSIAKQRTDRWLQLRKKSRVTGSTLFRALGLATLREQQEHFYNVDLFCTSSLEYDI